MGRKKFSVYIDEQLWKQARHVAIDLGITTSELIERALKEYFRNAALQLTK